MSATTEGPIRPYVNNRTYWEYRGQPVLLLGGSKTDHIFLLEDLEDHLDEIAAVGGNYVRCTMSQREGVELKPHRLLLDGRFDLDQWNEEYWQRFQNMLCWTAEYRIIVQIEVWDRFDYSNEFWRHSPWRPDNNVNYDEAESGLAPEYPRHPSDDRQPFFHSIPGMPRYRPELDLIRAHQERFVDKMLSFSLRHDHVLYCMDNETSTPSDWGKYWIRHIRRRAAEAGAEVYVTDMFNDVHEAEKSAQFRHQLENVEDYDFLDISQINSRNFGEEHWQRLEWIVEQAKTHMRPLNHTKIYSNGYYEFGTGGPQDGVERFMRNLIAGCASVRFHRPDAGIGLNAKAKAAIKTVRTVESLMKMWELTTRMDLLSNRTYNAAYLAAKPGEKYFLYFPYGDSVDLSLAGHSGAFTVKWVDVNTGDWGPAERVEGGDMVTITPPDPGGWIAAIVR